MTAFVKMHGCGNDFVVLRHADLEAFHFDSASLPRFVRDVCDRHHGLGADGLLTYATLSGERLRMHYWNRDGSRAEMCGNGARCVVRLAWERSEVGSPLELETDAGTHAAAMLPRPPAPPWVEIEMGAPRWDGASVGLRDGSNLLDTPLDLGAGELRVTALDLGNPHAVVFVRDRAALAAVELEATGRALAEHPLFRRGANASFVAVEGNALHLRVFERGVGPTLACGSASCAAFAAATRLGLLTASAGSVHLPGGSVEVRADADGRLWLRGPALRVAAGTLDPECLGV